MSVEKLYLVRADRVLAAAAVVREQRCGFYAFAEAEVSIDPPPDDEPLLAELEQLRKERDEARVQAERSYQAALEVCRMVGGCRHLRTAERPDLGHVVQCVTDTVCYWHEAEGHLKRDVKRLREALEGLRYRIDGDDEDPRFCDHAAEPCPKCERVREALRDTEP